jgi:alginate O-acetyltransferase complex protein AlgJ
LKSRISTDVHVGKDGWLFLIAGTNAVGTLYERKARLLSDAKLQQWTKLIEARARRLDAMGVQYVHVSVPEKLTIYDHKLNQPPVVDWRLSPALRLGEMLQRSPYAHVWLDLVGPFRAARNEEELYSKTDTHWCAAGCFHAYTLICNRIGIIPVRDLLRTRKSSEQGAYLDLGMKVEPPVADVFKFYDFIQNSRRVYVNPIAQCLETMAGEVGMHVGSHVGSHVRFMNETSLAANKKILIFGDSCSSQSSNALTGMLAETAREVEFIWSSNLDWAYIRSTRPDVVIYELAERFLTVVPNDRLSLRRTLAWRVLRAKWLQAQSLPERGGAKARLVAGTRMRPKAPMERRSAQRGVLRAQPVLLPPQGSYDEMRA